MTVQTAETKTHYAGNGLTTEWPIPFPVVQEEHIKLIKTSPDGVDEEITTGYTVNGMESGAVSITYPMTGEPLEAGWQLTIYRDMPLTQTLDLESGGAFDAEVIERQGFDHLVMQIQQVQEQVSRALLVAITDVDRDPNKIIDEIFVARTQAAAAAGNAEQSAYDSATSAQETQNLLDSVGVGTATHSGFTPLAPEGWEAGHGLILNEDGTTSYGPLLVDVPLASAPSGEHPDGVAGIVTPDGKSVILNDDNQVAVARHIPGVANFQVLTISSGVISPTVADVVVDTEGAAAADDLTEINIAEAQNGMILRLWAANEARVVTVKHSATLQLAGEVDRVLSQHGYLELKRAGTYWQETPRKDVLELQAHKLDSAAYQAAAWQRPIMFVAFNNGAATPAITYSRGIASISRTGTGLYEATFLTPQPDLNYWIVATVQSSAGYCFRCGVKSLNKVAFEGLSNSGLTNIIEGALWIYRNN